MGAAVRALGPSSVSLACMPCGGLRAAGVVGGRPGGWPSTVVRGVWCLALCLPRPPVAWGGQPGLRNPYFPGAGGVRVGIQQRPHSVPSWEPALQAVGMAGGRPRGGAAPRCCEGAPGVKRSPSPGCPSVGPAARACRSLAVGAGVSVWVCRPYVGRAAGRGCVWCVVCLCGVCVLVGAWRCGVCRGAVVRGAASLRPSPCCPPLLRYLLVLCLPWLGAVPPSPRASLARLLATLLLPALLRRSLPFPLLSVGLPSSLA